MSLQAAKWCYLSEISSIGDSRASRHSSRTSALNLFRKSRKTPLTMPQQKRKSWRLIIRPDKQRSWHRTSRRLVLSGKCSPQCPNLSRHPDRQLHRKWLSKQVAIKTASTQTNANVEPRPSFSNCRAASMFVNSASLMKSMPMNRTRTSTSK